MTTPFMRKGVVKMMSINGIRLAWHLTKAEKALKEGDNAKYRKHKDKANRLLLLKVRKG